MVRLLRPLALCAVAGLFAGPPPAPAAPAVPPGPKDKPSERLRDLQKERVKALEEQMEGLFERVKIGKDPVDTLIAANRELTEAELDLAGSPEAEGKVLENAVARFRQVEIDLSKLQQAGLQTKQNVAQAKAARVRAEIQLEKWKQRK